MVGFISVSISWCQELESERTKLMEDVASNKRKMKELEDNLLYRLTSTKVWRHITAGVIPIIVGTGHPTVSNGKQNFKSQGKVKKKLFPLREIDVFKSKLIEKRRASSRHDYSARALREVNLTPRCFPDWQIIFGKRLYAATTICRVWNG